MEEVRATTHFGDAGHGESATSAWIEIQIKTFANWVNEQLRPAGLSVSDFRKDFSDGVKLLALVESLQKRKLRKIQNANNHHQYLENVQTALNALATDNIKLVNIGSTDIVEGNFKLILGLIWQLILHYQIGKSSIPPKKLMLTWLQSSLPGLHVSNFTSDWNNGIVLSALLDYCRPGLFPNWKTLLHTDGLANCKNAMQIAEKELGVPMILKPEDLCHPGIDERSVMTYLSYFMKQKGGASSFSTKPMAPAPPISIDVANQQSSSLKPTPSPRATMHESSTETPPRQSVEAISALLAKKLPFGQNVPKAAVEQTPASQGAIQKTFTQSTWASPTPNESLSSGHKPQKLMNIQRITARGKGLKFVPVKRPVTFAINAPGFDQDDLAVTVTAPSGREIPTRMDTIRNGAYEVEYITPEVGDHALEVLALGKPITGSPFHSSAYDASKIKVGPMPGGAVGNSVEFEIDGSEAGSGNLEILVNGGRVTSEVKSLGNHRFLASFVPHTATEHVVEMKFNEEPVQGSPWKCEVVSSGHSDATHSMSSPKRGVLRVQTLENFPVSQTQFFDIISVGHSKEELDIHITAPSKAPVQFRIVDLQNDTFRVYFSASVVGTYLCEIAILSDTNSASSFTAKAFDISRIHVSDVPKNCLLGESCEFQVDASQAGEGQLEIAVNDGEVPNQVQVQGNGKCTVSFKPEACLSHIVDIKFNGQNVPGCPFTVDVSDATQFSVDLSQLELIAVGRVCRFHVASKNGVLRDTIRVVINSPTGKQLPVNLTYGDNCWCEFTPSEVGPHVMTIEHCGRSISAAPFFIKTYDAQKVIVTPTPYGCVGKPLQFVVDAGNSGEGNLEIAVNAKGLNVMTQVQPMGGAKFGVAFTPNEVCEHIVFVTFNNEPVHGSPFTVAVVADMDKVSVSGAALHFAPVEQSAVLTVHNIAQERDLFVKIEGPNGLMLPATLKQEAHSTAVTIEFYPLAAGEHLIHLSYKNAPLPGSPFSSKVYDISQIRVKEMPNEIIIGKPVTFLVEATNAGPGNLEVIVNNGKVASTPQALGPSLYAISFVPKEAETHYIEIKFNGELIPGAPFLCSVIDASKLIIRKEGLDRIPVFATATFVVETNGAPFTEQCLTILGPTHQALDATIAGDPSAGYKVSFTPQEVGDHLIDLKVGGESVPNCPLLVKVYDAKNVKISEIATGSIGKPVFFSIDASQAGAGNLEIIVSTSGRNVPNYVQSEGNAKFRVNFKPTEASLHTVSVKFNGEPVPGSPCVVNVVDTSQNVMSGQSLRMAALSKKVEFNVENRNDVKECKVFVTSPSGKKLKPVVNKSGGFFNISFVPSEVGPHQILVLLDNVTLPGSPVSCNVYDVSKVKASGLSHGNVGKPLTFQVDASQAGEGTLELVVTTRKSSVRAEVLMRSRGMYDVTFIPNEKVSHYVNITFNEEDVPGSPFKIEVKDGVQNGSLSRRTTTDSAQESRQVDENGRAQSSRLIGSPTVTVIEWPFSEEETENVEVKVTGPQGSAIPAAAKLENGKLTVEYTPREIGLYKVESYNKGALTSKKPVVVEVCDPSRVKLVNVQDGVVGREQTFKVDCTRAGRGDMTLSIRSGEKDVKHNVKEISAGVFLVTYVPKVDLPHYIDVCYNGYHAPGCPQGVEIRDPTQSIIIHGPALKSCTPGQAATFLIETGGFAAAKDFDVIITDPSGSPLPVKCYQQKDGSLLTEFNPLQTGAHKLEVLYLDNPVSGSPFTSEAFDASKVVLQKIKSTNFSVNEKIVFTLNRRDAGYAELDVTVTSPLGRHLPIEVKGTPDGEGELIEFMPTVSGKYKIGITFGGVEVPGSPVTFIAQEGNLPKVEGNGLRFGLVREPATFTINARELFGKPEIRVNGVDSEPQLTINEEGGIYKVAFVPEEVGVFDVRILWSGREIPGSPYHPQIVDLNNVRPIGGWENLLDGSDKIPLAINEEKRISFDVLGAGPGKLRAAIKGPEGDIKEAQVEQAGPSKYKLGFTPKVEGEYQVSLYYADHALPKSPLICVTDSATSSQSECATVVLRGHGLAGARVGEETEFIIDGHEAGNGQPEITLTGVKADIPIKVVQISQKVFKATYTPTIQGTYLLNVLWAQKQVKGCPLKVSILPRCDSSRVLCSGDGLKGGAVGKDIKAFIDTKRAGPGELTAHCAGPQKVAYCELYDQMDGTFTLFLKPQEGGRHLLTIKYGGEHVPGSPFALRIAGAPDASKVRVYGPGVEHGVLPLYQSRFICDTRGAGAGQLTVRIRGPKGAFRVEMQRESQKDRTILCKYDPTEPGDYRIEVKWSGENVPGSPFAVMIFDTQDELNRYTQQGQSRRTHSPAHSQANLPPVDYFGGNGNMQYGTGFGQLSWRGSNNDL